MENFRHQLTVLRELFRGLSSEEQPEALCLVRDFVSECQYKDAMRSVAAMAESMIQETYGISRFSAGSPPYVPVMHTENSLDSGDLLTNVLYETLRNEQTTQNNTAYTPLLGASDLQETQECPHNSGEGVEHATVDLVSECPQPQKIPQSHFQNHAASENLKKWRICEICGLKFKNSRRLYCHRKCHAKNKGENICVHCGNKMENGRKYSNHLAKVHNLGTKITKGHEFEESKSGLGHKKDQRHSWAKKNDLSHSDRWYVCAECSYIARFRQNLHRHTKRMHGKCENSKRNIFCCEMCDKKLSSKSALKEHYAYVHALNSRERLKCDICAKNFVMKKDLNRHFRTCHVECGKRPFECEFQGCGKSYKSRFHLKRHVLSAHCVVRV